MIYICTPLGFVDISFLDLSWDIVNKVKNMANKLNANRGIVNSLKGVCFLAVYSPISIICTVLFLCKCVSVFPGF